MFNIGDKVIFIGEDGRVHKNIRGSIISTDVSWDGENRYVINWIKPRREIIGGYPDYNLRLANESLKEFNLRNLNKLNK